MKITRSELKDLNAKGEVEVRIREGGKELWETITVEEQDGIKC